MKKIITIIATLLSVSAIAQDSTKMYTLKLTEQQLVNLYQTLEDSKTAILTSTIPMNKGVQTINNADSLQAIIKKEYLIQQPKTK